MAEMIRGSHNLIDSLGPVRTPSSQRTPSSDGTSFKDALQQKEALNKVKGFGEEFATASSDVRFSNHAIDRMQARGISYNPEQLMRIQSGMEKAATKGSQNALLLMDDSALIVSVKNNTVITVMDKGGMKENVFTNIDSTVFI